MKVVGGVARRVRGAARRLRRGRASATWRSLRARPLPPRVGPWVGGVEDRCTRGGGRRGARRGRNGGLTIARLKIQDSPFSPFRRWLSS